MASWIFVSLRKPYVSFHIQDERIVYNLREMKFAANL
jgi:hypothetical protein